MRERRWARLESACADLAERIREKRLCAAGSYRGERIVQHIPVKIPTSASKGSVAHSGKRRRNTSTTLVI